MVAWDAARSTMEALANADVVPDTAGPSCLSFVWRACNVCARCPDCWARKTKWDLGVLGVEDIGTNMYLGTILAKTFWVCICSAQDGSQPGVGNFLGRTCTEMGMTCSS